MTEKIKLGSFYETKCGLVAEVRTTDHNGVRPVVATVRHPAGSEDPDKKGAFYKNAVKQNRDFDLYGREYVGPDAGDSPYDFVREVGKPADWDEIPNPDVL